jgi:DNA-binding SARP family transcriptional activator
LPAPELALHGPVRLAGRVLPDERPTQLLVLLACSGGVMPRHEAAAQLWPALDEAAGLRNLRKTLHRLRLQHGEAPLLADTTRLQLQAATDLAAIEDALQQGRAAEALARLQGPLAQGLYADEAEPAWLQAARAQALARWRRALLAALPTLDAARAEAELERLRALDPLDEPLLRAHLELLAAAGRREAWLRERRRHEQGLQAAHGQPPAPALPADPGPAPDDRRAPPAAAAPGFIGREDELERLRPLLARPGLRLLLRGPGGVGKTRLAAELARHAAAFGLALVWWPLAEAEDTAAALSRLAAELGADTSAPGATMAALAAALRRRPALVVADNAEHLMGAPADKPANKPSEGPADAPAGGSELGPASGQRDRPAAWQADGAAAGFAAALHALATAAPEARWLITSRQATALGGVHDEPVAGLDLPDPADPPGAVLRSAAVKLLVARASAQQPGFEARAQAAGLGRLARALDGHPLALELAAAQLRHTRADTLAAEAEAGEAPTALEPLFAASWRMLPAPLQAALVRVAVLPAGLSRHVLLAAGGLRPEALQALVLASWLEPEPASDGPPAGSPDTPAVAPAVAPAPVPTPSPSAGHLERWRLHPLLRAWLRRHHPASAATAAAAQQAAAEAALAGLQPELAPGGTDRPGALDRLERELPLLRVALALAVARADTPRLAALVPALAALFEQRGRRDEGLALLAEAATRLAGRPLAARGPVQSARALLSYRAGRHDEALLLARGLARAAPRERATAARTQGLVLWQRGQLDEARHAFERAHALAVEHGFDDLVPDAINNLAILDQMAGREAEAERGYRRVAQLAEARGSARLQALALLNLGSMLHPMGQGRASRQALESALALIDTRGLHSLLPHALVNLAGALLEIGDAEAVAALRKLMPRLRAALPAGEAPLRVAQRQLEALLHARHGNPHEAWLPLREGWRDTVALGLVPLQLGLVLIAAQAWAAAGQRRRALAWLAWQQAQPTQWEADRREAARLWALLRPSEEEAEAARETASSLSLATLGQQLDATAHPAG